MCIRDRTLAVKEISAILHMIPVEKRSLYNKELVNRIYLEYQSHTAVTLR